MSRDGLAPRRLSSVSARTDAPWAAVLVSGGAVAAVALTLSVKQTAGVGGFLYVLHFVLPLITLIVLRRRGGTASGFRTPAAPVVLTLALAICAVFLGSTGWRVSLAGVAWVVVGVAAYGALGRGERSGRSPWAPEHTPQPADTTTDDSANPLSTTSHHGLHL
jgi:APA family basic amino acid/polyamine antiporter